VVAYMVEVLGLERQIKEAGRLGDPLPMYPLFSPGNPRAASLAALVTQGVRTLRKSGELQAILDRYGAQDWERP